MRPRFRDLENREAQKSARIRPSYHASRGALSRFLRAWLPPPLLIPIPLRGISALSPRREWFRSLLGTRSTSLNERLRERLRNHHVCRLLSSCPRATGYNAVLLWWHAQRIYTWSWSLSIPPAILAHETRRNNLLGSFYPDQGDRNVDLGIARHDDPLSKRRILRVCDRYNFVLSNVRNTVILSCVMNNTSVYVTSLRLKIFLEFKSSFSLRKD